MLPTPSRRHLRRTLFVLWVPTLLVFSLCTALIGFVPAETASPLVDVPLNTDTSLFAAAPPTGDVLGDTTIAAEALSADNRVHQVERFLESKGSPMAAHAATFVAVADTQRLDWRLLVAIPGKESSYGKRIPPGSYNAWGWGIPTGAQRGIGFSSWDEGIATVGKGLREKYFDKGYNTLAKIEQRYTPPSYANPEHPWRTGVAQFMAELESF